MNITAVRIKKVDLKDDKLKAYCAVTIDGEFVVTDIKVIEGTQGLFIAMPSRRITDKCQKCAGKNHLRAKFCNECSARLNPDRAMRDESGRVRVHADIAHPINAASRETIERRILESFTQEVERSKQPGYKPVEIFEGEDYESDGV